MATQKHCRECGRYGCPTPCPHRYLPGRGYDEAAAVRADADSASLEELEAAETVLDRATAFAQTQRRASPHFSRAGARRGRQRMDDAVRAVALYVTGDDAGCTASKVANDWPEAAKRTILAIAKEHDLYADIVRVALELGEMP